MSDIWFEHLCNDIGINNILRIIAFSLLGAGIGAIFAIETMKIKNIEKEND